MNESILEKYKKRLINFSGRNKTLKRNKITKGQAFDLKKADQYEKNLVSSVIEEILKDTGKEIRIVDKDKSIKLSEAELEKIDKNYLKLMENSKSVMANYSMEELEDIANDEKLQEEVKNYIRMDKIQKIKENLADYYKKLDVLKYEIDATEKEKGLYQMYVGYPFVEGVLEDGTEVRGPLVLYPCKLKKEGSTYNYINLSDNPIYINRSLLLAYTQATSRNFDNIKDEYETAEEIFNLEEPIKTQKEYLDRCREFLLNNGIKIEEEENTEVKEYIGFKKDSYRQFRKGELHLRNYILIGQYSIANNSIYKDYERLMENGEIDHELINNLLSYDDEAVYDNSDIDTVTENSGKIDEKKSYFITELDYSQEKAIKMSEELESLVVYGPPGTGKSQVIANIVSDNLAKNKKVLVVSEKRTALDVVYKRLEKCHLSDRLAFVHDIKSDRKKVMEKIIAILENAEDNFDLKETKKVIKKISDKIEIGIDKLDALKEFLFEKQPCGRTLYELYSNSKLTDPTINKIMRNFDEYDFLNYEELILIIKKFNDMKDKLEYDEIPILSQRRNFSDVTELKNSNLISLLEDVDNYCRRNISEGIIKDLKNEKEEFYSELYNNLKDEKELFENVVGKRKMELESELISTVEKIKETILKNINQLKEDISFGLSEDKEERKNALDNLESRVFRKLDTFEEIKKEFMSLSFFAILRKMKLKKEIMLLEYGTTLEAKLERIEELRKLKDFKEKYNLLSESLENIILNKDKLAEEEILSLSLELDEVNKKFEKGMDSFEERYIKLEDTLKNIELNSIEKLEKIKDTVKDYGNEEYSKKIEEEVILLKETREKMKALREYLDVDVFELLEKVFNSEEISLDGILDVLKNKFGTLRDYDFKKSKFSEQEKILFEMLKKAENKDEFLERLKNSYCLNWINQAEEKNIGVISNIENFNKIKDKTFGLIQDKKTLVPKYISNLCDKNISSHFTFNRSGNEVTYRELKKEANKKRKTLSLRSYIDKFKNQGLFEILPCWLLTPDLVSEILPLQKNMFDIIIFDEASQMFIERAIPAIYRSKKIVVAGDDKQLQPNRVGIKRFEEMENMDEEELDEDIDSAAIHEISLLDVSKEMYKSSLLSYHYRSNYEELINFSNYAFYKGRLIVAPNKNGDDYLPIERIKVNGFWENRKNIQEAEEVYRLVKKLLIERKEEESIGIVTFNSGQQEAIRDYLEYACEKDDEFSALYQREKVRYDDTEDKSIFVKNIENVQGDERDIIIFSVGYGRDPEKGRVSTNFGTLTHQGGENRLNVGISRAKKKIYVITSIEPTELNVSNAKNRGPILFKKYLEYTKAISERDKETAETILSSLSTVATVEENSVVEFDSPFEEEVYDALRDRGYTVRTQIGVSGYRIDLGIYSEEKGEYILGIECDGATYHSSPSARERDIYRQKFLESKNWKIHRIWSKDWWRDPKKELAKIENILNNIFYFDKKEVKSTEKNLKLFEDNKVKKLLEKYLEKK